MPLPSQYNSLGNEMSLVCGWLPRTWGKYIVTGVQRVPETSAPDQKRQKESRAGTLTAKSVRAVKMKGVSRMKAPVEVEKSA